MSFPLSSRATLFCRTALAAIVWLATMAAAPMAFGDSIEGRYTQKEDRVCGKVNSFVLEVRQSAIITYLYLQGELEVIRQPIEQMTTGPNGDSFLFWKALYRAGPLGKEVHEMPVMNAYEFKAKGQDVILVGHFLLPSLELSDLHSMDLWQKVPSFTNEVYYYRCSE